MGAIIVFTQSIIQFNITKSSKSIPTSIKNGCAHARACVFQHNSGTSIKITSKLGYFI